MDTSAVILVLTLYSLDGVEGASQKRKMSSIEECRKAAPREAAKLKQESGKLVRFQCIRVTAREYDA
jgi:hypothetical protein